MVDENSCPPNFVPHRIIRLDGSDFWGHIRKGEILCRLESKDSFNEETTILYSPKRGNVYLGTINSVEYDMYGDIIEPIITLSNIETKKRESMDIIQLNSRIMGAIKDLSYYKYGTIR